MTAYNSSGYVSACPKSATLKPKKDDQQIIQTSHYKKEPVIAACRVLLVHASAGPLPYKLFS
jgi:hypothetical protein